MSDFHLAQVNIATLRAPLDDPQLVDFVVNLEPINALADASDGFVWRLQTDEGDATALRVFDDDSIIVNMSVWESVEALRAFVYGSAHTDVMRRRADWFQRMAEAYLALWWMPAGEVPSTDEAAERIAAIQAQGPTAYAFNFRAIFTPDGQRLSG
jgi:hypothetical protein